jgi:aspartate kinase
MKSVSYEEMLEMASLGSKVLQIRSVEFASKYKVPLRVLSSLIDNPTGTLITSEENIMEQAVISGIAHNKDEAKLSLIGVPDEPGIAYKILKPISEANIEVDMIVQSVSAREGLTNFAFTVHRNDFNKAQKILKDICHDLKAKAVQSDSAVVKVSLVGIGMRSHAGLYAIPGSSGTPIKLSFASSLLCAIPDITACSIMFSSLVINVPVGLSISDDNTRKGTLYFDASCGGCRFSRGR